MRILSISRIFDSWSTKYNFVIFLIPLLFSLFLPFATASPDLILQERGEVQPYEIDIQYEIGELLEYENVIYEVVQSHTSQTNWIPSEEPALYTSYTFQSLGELSYFTQPTGSQDAYDLGDRVIYNENVYESDIDANVWNPEEQPTLWIDLGTFQEYLQENSQVVIDGDIYYNSFGSIQTQNDLTNANVNFQDRKTTVENYEGNHTFEVTMYTGDDNVTYGLRSSSEGYLGEVTSNNSFITFETDSFSTITATIPNQEVEVGEFVQLGANNYYSGADGYFLEFQDGSGGLLNTDANIIDNGVIEIRWVTGNTFRIDGLSQTSGSGVRITPTVDGSLVDSDSQLFFVEVTEPEEEEEEPPTQISNIPNVNLENSGDVAILEMNDFFSNYDDITVNLGSGYPTLGPVSLGSGGQDSYSGDFEAFLEEFSSDIFLDLESVGTQVSTTVQVTASNSDGSVSDSFSLTIDEDEGNDNGDENDNGNGNDDNGDSNGLDLTSLNDATLSYWTFDENTGTTAGDSVGNNDGTINGASWVNGIINSGLSFDGSNDFVSIDEIPSVSVGTPLSFSSWINVNSLGDPQVIFYHVVSSSNRFHVGIGPDDNLHFSFFDGSNWVHVEESDSPLNTNTWYHIAYSYDGTNSDLYINSVLQDNNVRTFGVSSSTIDSVFGYRPSQNDNHYNGVLDEPAIFDRALNSDEIDFLYANGNPDSEQQYEFSTESQDPPSQIASIPDVSLQGTENTQLSLSTYFEDFEGAFLTFDADGEERTLLGGIDQPQDSYSGEIDVQISGTSTDTIIQIGATDTTYDETFNIEVFNANGEITDTFQVTTTQLISPDINLNLPEDNAVFQYDGTAEVFFDFEVIANDFNVGNIELQLAQAGGTFNTIQTFSNVDSGNTQTYSHTEIIETSSIENYQWLVSYTYDGNNDISQTRTFELEEQLNPPTQISIIPSVNLLYEESETLQVNNYFADYDFIEYTIGANTRTMFLGGSNEVVETPQYRITLSSDGNDIDVLHESFTTDFNANPEIKAINSDGDVTGSYTFTISENTLPAFQSIVPTDASVFEQGDIITFTSEIDTEQSYVDEIILEINDGTNTQTITILDTVLNPDTQQSFSEEVDISQTSLESSGEYTFTYTISYGFDGSTFDNEITQANSFEIVEELTLEEIGQIPNINLEHTDSEVISVNEYFSGYEGFTLTLTHNGTQYEETFNVGDTVETIEIPNIVDVTLVDTFEGQDIEIISQSQNANISAEIEVFRQQETITQTFDITIFQEEPSESIIISLVNNFLNIFPDNEDMNTGQRYAFVLIFISVFAVIVGAIAYSLTASGIAAIVMAGLVSLFTFMFFVGIGYIGIGTLIMIGLLILGIFGLNMYRRV